MTQDLFASKSNKQLFYIFILLQHSLSIRQTKKIKMFFFILYFFDLIFFFRSLAKKQRRSKNFNQKIKKFLVKIKHKTDKKFITKNENYWQ
jgi:hypothetical protein